MWLTLSTVLLSMACAFALVSVASLWGRGARLFVMAVLDWLGLAARSLATEAAGVEKALGRGLSAGRKAWPPSLPAHR